MIQCLAMDDVARDMGLSLVGRNTAAERRMWNSGKLTLAQFTVEVCVMNTLSQVLYQFTCTGDGSVVQAREMRWGRTDRVFGGT
jgi:hypothetical protein